MSVDAAVAAMFVNDMGANAALMYDKMVKKLLSEEFSVQDELDLIGESSRLGEELCPSAMKPPLVTTWRSTARR